MAATLGGKWILATLWLGLMGSAGSMAQAADLASADSNTPTSAAGASVADAFAQQVETAAQFEDGDDPAAAERVLSKALGNPRFASLPLDLRRKALSTAAWTAALQDKLGAARERYLQAIALDSTEPDDFYRLALVERGLDHHDAAVTALTQLVTRWPELANNLDSMVLGPLALRSDAKQDTRVKLVQALFDANYTRNALGADEFWYELAAARLDRGEHDAARLVIARITDPTALIKLRVDQRFDPLVDRDDPHFDVGLAAQAQMDDLRTRALLDPTRVDLLMQLSYAMLAMGQHEDMIAMADAALPATAGKMEKASLFESVEDRVWLMNNRTIALRRVGRIDEALAQMKYASTQGEGEERAPNVSQILNLGSFYCALGRPREALEAILAVGNMSGYGKMVHSMVKLRAYRQLGRQREANKELGYLRTHREDSQQIYMRALLEMDHMEEAAATYIALLDDPDTRADALLQAQAFKAPAPLPGNQAGETRWHQLLDRSDVSAAIARVGRIEQYPIYDLVLD
jgi:tetratricopeptide (TPR) repeat protein